MLKQVRTQTVRISARYSDTPARTPQPSLNARLIQPSAAAFRLSGMTKHTSTDLIDEGTTHELQQEKEVAESLLREEAQSDQKNVNDQPGFDDGRLGGADGEDRQGEPNVVGGSDLRGEAEGGAGTGRSGGVDGGPQRTTPLPK